MKIINIPTDAPRIVYIGNGIRDGSEEKLNFNRPIVFKEIVERSRHLCKGKRRERGNGVKEEGTDGDFKKIELGLFLGRERLCADLGSSSRRYLSERAVDQTPCCRRLGDPLFLGLLPCRRCSTAFSSAEKLPKVSKWCKTLL